MMLTELIASILRDVREGRLSKEEGLRRVRELKATAERPAQTPTRTEIAIIGVSGRYPQAPTLSAFWEQLRAGKNAITEVPAGRWNAARAPYRWGGFLDDIDRFDARFFNISPREAERMDPQERLFLETSWATLEDAGYTRRGLQLDGQTPGNVGVFVGVTYQEYQLYGAELQSKGTATALSGISAGIANRCSYFFNFHGPSLSVDTMCSSSLTAIHLACQSLRLGECEVALAGGVNLSLHPNKYLILSQGQFVSSKGQCESFGADGDGYVPGEGVGCVLLKPLSDAVRDRDHIYGVIKGTALNHGGKTNGYTVPNPHAQAAVIRQAMATAGVTPGDVSYIEAHGTGTSLGDPIEITGLAKAYSGATQTDAGARCAIGSVKSNIGHCEAAAGVAGVTKVLLQLQHGELVPSLHAETLNPNIDFAATPFDVQRTLAPWLATRGPRIAGVSSFGAGGSNAHLLIEEWREPVAPARATTAGGGALVVISAQTPERLLAAARQLCEHAAGDIADVAYTLQTGREALECRLALVARDARELRERLTSWLTDPRRVAGVWTGQGTRDLPTRTTPRLEPAEAEAVEAAITRRDLAALGKLWVQGIHVDWERLYLDIAVGEKPRRVSLPSYPFDHAQRYWYDSYQPKPRLINDAPAVTLPVELSVVSCLIVDDAIAVVRMRDREHRNQMAGAMVSELERIFTAISTDERIKVVVLSGDDDVFCLGGTKEALVGISDGKLKYSDVPFVYRGLLDCPVPVIAAMEGHAIGGGLAFGCQADMIYLAEESVYGANFMQYGFTPGMGGTLFFKEKFGANLANELMFTADSLTGQTLKSKGAPVTITPRAEVLGEAMGKARSLAVKPRNALVLLKQTLAGRLLEALPAVVAEELAMHDETITRPDVRQQIEGRIDRMESLSQPKVPQAAPVAPMPASAPSASVAPAASPSAAANLDDIRRRLQRIVGHLLHMDEAAVRPDVTFQDMGVDSIAAVELARDVNSAYGLNLDAVVLYDCPTVEKYARYIADQVGRLNAAVSSARANAPAVEPVSAPTAPVVSAKLVLPSLGAVRSEPLPSVSTPAPGVRATPRVSLAQPASTATQAAPIVATPTPRSTPAIAVIGMAGQFPGAADLDAFWRNLTDGVCSVSEVPESRWRIDDVFDPTPMRPNKTYSRVGGFIDGVEEFDALFFRLSPAEAAQMDPQQRLFLQAAWHAVEDAGYAAEDLAGTACGVFVGVAQGDYLNVLKAASQTPAAQSLMGNTCSMLAGRIAYVLDVNGPNLAIDTACSSSAVAIHQACVSLQTGESTLALAGGVSIMTTPTTHIMTSRGAMLSPTGQCRAFDDAADGFVLGEGVGVLVLKRLDQAEADGDHIYAVIRGTGINYDGATNGITAPSAVSQQKLESNVYERNGIDPAGIGLVEAHGTGTKLGDPIEFKALTQAFRAETTETQFCAIGSVKSNIGHGLAAAGVAGAIKAVLCLHHRELVPTLHVERVNSHIDLASSPFYVNTDRRAFPLAAGRSTRMAALSSFGLSGTNAHLVFEEYAHTATASSLGGPQLVTLSAKTPEALTARMVALASWIESHGERLQLADIAFTLNRGRSHFDYRCALVARSVADIAMQLREAMAGRASDVLTGHGSVSDAADRAIYPEVWRQLVASLNTVDPLGDAAREKLRALAGIYVKGYSVARSEWPVSSSARRVSLPGYPFARERHWADAPAADAPHQTRVIRRVLTGRESFVADHLVQGRAIVPGAALLEIIRETVSASWSRTVTMIADVAWLRPVMVDATAPQTIVLRCTEGPDGVRCELGLEQAGWEVCARATAAWTELGVTPAIDLTSIRARCAEHLTSDDCYAAFERAGLSYGPSFRTVMALQCDHGEALAELRAGRAVDTDGVRPILIPGLLDGSLQSGVGIGSVRRELASSAPSVPYALGRLTIHMALPDHAFAWARRTVAGAFEIDICDATGRVCVSLRDVWARPMAETGPGVLALAREWTAADRAPVGDAVSTRLLLTTPSAATVASAVSSMLGDVPVVVLGDAAAPEAVFLPVFDTVQGIARLHPTGGYQIGLLHTEIDDPCVIAALTGLLRTSALENPQIHGKVVRCESARDLPAQTALVADELRASSTGVVEVRWSGEADAREVQQLVEAPFGLAPDTTPFREGGVYWITGGGGGLGAATARHIARTRGTRIVLSGRSEADARTAMLLGELTAAGADAIYVRCDVSVFDQVRDAVAGIRARFGAITGIIHSAGVIRDAFILKKTPDQVREVLAPKVAGVRNIERALDGTAPEWMVLYSAAAGSLGNLGQCDYAGANAFLDAYARTSPWRVMSIGWPLWAEGGMTVDADTAARMRAAGGAEPMPTAVGMQVLDDVLNGHARHVLVMYGKRDTLRRALLGAAVAERTAVSPPVAAVNEADVQALLAAQIAVPLRLSADRIDIDRSFDEYGIDSVMVLEVTEHLEKSWGPLPKTLFFEFATVRALSRHMQAAYPAQVASLLGASRTPEASIPPVAAASQPDKINVPVAPRSPMTGPLDVAIVGLSGRYPGARTVREFWRNLREGRDSITEIPSDRWDHSRYYDAHKNGEGKVRSKWGGFLDDVSAFDPYFFKISPLEAEVMDPQERLLLESAWEAFEDAGYTRDLTTRRRVGCYVGVMYSEYQLFGAAEQALGRPVALGGSPASIANRVSYHLNLCGPSLAVDSMCSSSLTAIYLACQALRAGAIDMAVAGGVNLSLHPNKYLLLGQGQFVSSKGRCESFGVGGDGYVPGEGVGCVVLKSLAQATADGDHIYGVIKGLAINHGGKTTGYTVPNPAAQHDVIAAALAEAGMSPREISYVEAHGTGTSLGDPIEIEGLTRAYRTDDRRTGRCAIGSVKSNIGHCEAAAGMAGLTKVLLQMQHRELVPSLHSATLNPHIAFDQTPFVVQQQVAPWEPSSNGSLGPGVRVAGLSSFGAGGSNAHVVIAEWQGGVAASAAPGPVVIALSARTEPELRAVAANLREDLVARAHEARSLASIAYTLQVGREAMACRVAFVAESVEGVVDALGTWLDGRRPDASRHDALERVAAQWMSGQTVDWHALYPGGRPGRVSLPTYPFAREHYWVPQVATPVSAGSVHEYLFSGDEPWLRDHVINGQRMVPGVAYLQMARRAAAAVWPALPVTLSDVVWVQPCVWQAGLRVRVALTPRAEAFDFEISSDDGRETRTHCRGSVIATRESMAAERVNVEALKMLPALLTGDASKFYDAFARVGIVYGANYRHITHLWADESRCLAWVDASRASGADALSQSAVADAAMQAIGGFPATVSDGAALPFSLQHARIPERWPSSFYVEVVRTSTSQYDVIVADADGRVCAEWRGLAVRSSGDPLCGLTYQVEWQPKPAPVGFRREPLGRATFVVAGARSRGLDAQLVHAEGGAASLSTEAFIRAVADGADVQRVYFLGGLDDRECDATSPGVVIEQHAASTQALYQCVKALLAARHDEHALDLIVCTQDTQPVPGTATLQPGGAGLHGFCQSLARECGRWAVTLVDVESAVVLDQHAHAALVERIAQEPPQQGRGTVAYRGPQRFVPAVTPVTLPATSGALSIRDGGTYVIVGGTGGLGFAFSDALVTRHRAQVIWFGRRPVDAGIEQQIAALASRGPAPHYIQADITDARRMAEVCEELRRAGTTIHGVIHSALALNDQSLQRMTERQFSETTAAKVAGTAIFADTVGRMATDFCAFFSSAQSVMSAPGQGNYAAGSTFEDAYAHAIRSQRGCAVRVINWGYWGEVGVAASDDARERMAREGVGSITATEGWLALRRVLGSPATQVIVMRLSESLRTRVLAGASNDSAPAVIQAPAAGASLTSQAEAFVAGVIASTLKIPAARITSTTKLESLGVDSILGVVLTDRLDEIFGRLPRTLVFEYQSVDALAGYLVEHHAERLRDVAGIPVASASPASPVAPPDAPRQMAAAPAVVRSAVSSEAPGPIAIIGISGRFPGARDLSSYWSNLRGGVSSIREVPADRWDADRFYAAGPSTDRLKARSKWGGFIDDVDKCDPLLFNIAPVEAELIDPQERLFLQTVWEVLEDAGYTRRRLSDEQERTGQGVGVFVGAMYQMYPLVARMPAMAANSYWSIANRASYFFDFRGPSLAIDTACSSAMVAIHSACESLRRGECSYAVAGGVNLSLHPNKYLSLHSAGMLGSEPVSKSLGRGDGFVPGEGVSAVLLKPLADAERDGDLIHGVIRASRVHHSGQGNGYRVPNPNEQARSVTRLFADAGVGADTISYVEVAANGIDLGDSIEIAGLSKAFQRSAGAGYTVPIGSVKSNIGHLEAASGMSQLAKVLLQMRHDELAPTLHADPPNPNLSLETTPFRVQTTATEWRASAGHPRRALINSVGAGGTNAHLILEEYLGRRRAGARVTAAGTAGAAVIVLSARDEERLRDVAQRLRTWIEGTAPTSWRLEDMAYTLQVAREPMAERLAVVAGSVAELRARLDAYLNGASQADQVLRGSAGDGRGAEALMSGPAGRAFIDALIQSRDLDKLARVWVSGVEVEWTRLYAQPYPDRIELPTYPFERRRCWVQASPIETTEVRLSAATVATASEPVPTALRDGLRRIVADTIKVSPSEIRDDRPLAEYGVESMLSTVIMEAVRERFGSRLSLAAIIEHPTIEQLATYVAGADVTPGDEGATTPPELIPIQPTGTKPASFWVHGLVGFAHLYKRLSAVLGPDYPVYGLQARGLDGRQPPFTDVPAMAAHYVACVRTVQPHGPYYLGGYSSGGVIALEMGRQLAAAGETVARVFLLDSYPNNARTTTAMEGAMNYAMRAVMTANLFLTGDGNRAACLRVEELDGVVPDQHVMKCLELIQARNATPLPAEKIYQMLRGSIDVSNNTGEAFRQYHPEPYSASDVVFFQATGRFIEAGNSLSLPQTELDAGDREEGWRAAITSRLEVVNTPCDHFGLLEDPVARTVGNLIAERMEPAPARRVSLVHHSRPSEAIVIGAGFAGLTVARVLADHFEHVTVLERDELAEGAGKRKGVPQGNHLHNLLKGGLNVLYELFPGFERDLLELGSVPFRAGFDMRQEDEHGVWPQRDFGITHYCQSRPLLEWAIRRRLQHVPNVRIEDGVRTQSLVWSDDGRRVAGITVTGRDGRTEERHADLVVNATGRSRNLLLELAEKGWTLPEETQLPTVLGYATCLFETPEDPSRTWKGLYSYSDPKSGDVALRGGSILPIEHNRWIVTLGGRHGIYPPTEMEGFLEFARQFSTPTIYDAIRNAKPVTGVIEQFRLTVSALRHFDRLEQVPERLLHVGDVICSFDPVFGQGMASAALQIKALMGVLAATQGQPDPLRGIERAFFQKAATVVATPWQLAATSHRILDAAAQKQEDEKQARLAQQAQREPIVHKTLLEVFHLMKVYDQLHVEQVELADRRAAVNAGRI